MPTMNISLPESLRAYVEEQVSQRRYGTTTEYVRDLIRRDQDRQHLRDLLMAGATSEPGPAADGRYFDELRDEADLTPGRCPLPGRPAQARHPGSARRRGALRSRG